MLLGGHRWSPIPCSRLQATHDWRRDPGRRARVPDQMNLETNQNLSERPESAANKTSPAIQYYSPVPTEWLPASEIQIAGGMRLAKWVKLIGISKMTAWRWRKEGKFPVIWRYGIPWVTAETIRQFFTDDGTAPRRPVCIRNPKRH
jgi:hypothetical protein